MRQSKPAAKARNRTEKARVKIILFTLKVFVGVIIIMVAPLMHIGWPTENPKVREYRLSLEPALQEIKDQIKALDNTYDHGEMAASTYVAQHRVLTAQLENKSKEVKKLVRLKADQELFFGWKTIRVFLIGFGIRLPYLVFSIIITMFVFLLRDLYPKYFRKKWIVDPFFWLQTGCYGISLYLVIWCFWYSDDYRFEVWWWAMLIFTTIASAITLYAFRSYKTVYGKLASLRASMYDFFVEILNIHYKKPLRKAIKANLYDEVAQEELKRDTNQLEERLRDKAEELYD